MKPIKEIVKYLSVLLIVISSLSAIAQQPYNGEGGRPKGEKIEALRVAFITNRLNLSPQEAQQFWPVYNAYRDDLKTLRKNYKQEAHDHKPLADMNDKEAEEITNQKMQFEQAKVDLDKRYKPQFQEVLGAKKFAMLLDLERQFKLEVLKQLRNRREEGGRREMPPPPGR